MITSWRSRNAVGVNIFNQKNIRKRSVIQNDRLKDLSYFQPSLFFSFSFISFSFRSQHFQAFSLNLSLSLYFEVLLSLSTYFSFFTYPYLNLSDSIYFLFFLQCFLLLSSLSVFSLPHCSIFFHFSVLYFSIYFFYFSISTHLDDWESF